MGKDRSIIITNSIKKAEEALEDARLGLREKRLSLALNRSYYAVFYAAHSLGYKYNFVTSKHSQLKGWFNKELVYSKKVFDKKLAMIFNKVYKLRQESDYELLDIDSLTDDDVRSTLEEAEEFVEQVKSHLKITKA